MAMEDQRKGPQGPVEASSSYAGVQEAHAFTMAHRSRTLRAGVLLPMQVQSPRDLSYRALAACNDCITNEPWWLENGEGGVS